VPASATATDGRIIRDLAAAFPTTRACHPTAKVVEGISRARPLGRFSNVSARATPGEATSVKGATTVWGRVVQDKGSAIAPDKAIGLATTRV